VNNNDMEFECESCGVMFKETLYGIDREQNKVIFCDKGLLEVDIRSSENIANFCSHSCRERGREAVMRKEQVPERRVGVEPIEPCAKCGGPVDMSDWHLTYVESDTRFTGDVGDTLDIDYLVVLCKRCTERRESTEEASEARASS
jgi:hypothetical protein